MRQLGMGWEVLLCVVDTRNEVNRFFHVNTNTTPNPRQMITSGNTKFRYLDFNITNAIV